MGIALRTATSGVSIAFWIFRLQTSLTSRESKSWEKRKKTKSKWRLVSDSRSGSTRSTEVQSSQSHLLRAVLASSQSKRKASSLQMHASESNWWRSLCFVARMRSITSSRIRMTSRYSLPVCHLRSSKCLRRLSSGLDSLSQFRMQIGALAALFASSVRCPQSTARRMRTEISSKSRVNSWTMTAHCRTDR